MTCKCEGEPSCRVCAELRDRCRARELHRREQAVIDAAREVVRMYDRESLDMLDAAVWALDDGGAER